jgi:hypothetical protein
MTNWKFHAIALTSIIVTITVVFLLVRNQPISPDDVAAGNFGASDRFIQIYSASYGLNCNDRIRRYRNNYQSTFETINPNNVLLEVSRLCNGRDSCIIDVREAGFDNKTMPSCSKDLDVTFRCFSWDRLQHAVVGAYEQLVIDCRIE